MDNGPEFIAQPARDCIVAVEPNTAYIEPGSLWKNGYCVSFAGRFRDELLTRDRKAVRDSEIDELKASISDIGLSNPIQVLEAGDGYELVQGYRRMTAFRELY
jgi:hypothetical protein